jgi:adenylate cyclase
VGRVRVRELRLISGLVLLLFVLTHLANHALGLMSVSAMDRGLAWFTLIWHHPIATGLLYGAVLVHFLLGLYALYNRQILRMPARELAQLLLGLILPFLLVEHVIGTRLSYALTGKQVTYAQVVYTLWIAAPNTGLRQVLALLVAWLHGCLGLYFWLRHRPWFANYSILLYTAALVIPLLALLGFAEAGKDLLAIAYEPPAAPLPADLKTAVGRAFYGLFAGLILSTFAARLARRYVSWTSKIRVAYATGQVAIVPRGFTVLEASRSAGIPHVAVCGGRGRCSTCRVRVLDGLEGQPPPSSQEQATLHRIKAVENVRLACQFRPVHDVIFAPILAAGRLRLLESESRSARGREHVITVLFCDLRAFTTLSERRLPFDIVFLLNRYFEVVGHAVEETGGLVDKFVGDGALAIFGLDGSRKRAARQAIAAALLISRGVAELNRTYASELDRPLRLAMSLHTGPAIIGEMGYGAASQLTAVGDTINTASRLEGIAKDLDAELVISEEVTRTAELAPPEYDLQSFAMRGRSAPVMAWIVKDTKSITHLVENGAVNV